MAKYRQRVRVPVSGVHPLVKLLFDEMNDQRVAMIEMADRSGVSVNTLRNWRRRASPTLDNLAACFQVLGIEIGVNYGDAERTVLKPSSHGASAGTGYFVAPVPKSDGSL